MDGLTLHEVTKIETIIRPKIRGCQVIDLIVYSRDGNRMNLTMFSKKDQEIKEIKEIKEVF